MRTHGSAYPTFCASESCDVGRRIRPMRADSSFVKSYLKLAHSRLGLKFPSALSRERTCTTPVSLSVSVKLAWMPRSLSGVGLQLPPYPAPLGCTTLPVK